MVHKKTGFAFLVLLHMCFLTTCQQQAVRRERSADPLQDADQEMLIQTGAERTDLYFPLLKGKRCVVTTNHTGRIGSVGLVDSLVHAGIVVVKIFSPEHGYRGTVSDGETVTDAADAATGIPVVSLYGAKRKPSPGDLSEADLVLYDIQDVGVRCYTYISTLQYVMEACAGSRVPLLILDRPDPLGFYVDGPVLDTNFRSFVGMHPVPLVYGLTVGELALMINGEGWLGAGLRCDLQVIPCNRYTHSSRYSLPVNPSPNLQDMEAVYLYPSVALFEGTVMNVGRGTSFSYRVFGHPEYPVHTFSYTPRASASNVNPKHKDRLCYGLNLQDIPIDTLRHMTRINLSRLIGTYRTMNRSDFFLPFFDRLAGTDALRKQVEAGWSEEQIRRSWEPALEKYRQMRKKYLLYPD